jgi:hypothetical protein
MTEVSGGPRPLPRRGCPPSINSFDPDQQESPVYCASRGMSLLKPPGLWLVAEAVFSDV